MTVKATATRKRTSDNKLAGNVPRPTPESVAINVAIPRELHRKLRIKQVGEGLTLADAVIAAIQAWVK